MRLTRSMAAPGWTLGFLGLCVAIIQWLGGGPAWAGTEPEKIDPVALSHEIFNREWLPGDAQSRR